ncbi:SDR family NAD(P)-dependent oxidoreductase [Sphingobacterium lumbrici]|uniref:SDR family NAD(P)-dependent oxidoreductase n=1 Tax=Sphingobacterium lumbrici TaxID=2559600 RepID=UPI001F25A3D9|nr:glucose 1-dehydrogenase [Sphingobacterium lumbrici]
MEKSFYTEFKIGETVMKLLEGKVILITGGTAGIGLSCAQAYTDAGAAVVCVGNDTEQIKMTKEILGESGMVLVADVSKAQEVEEIVYRTIKHFGRLDVVHNNAGIASPSKPLHLTNEDEWDRLMHVNVKSILLTTQFAYPYLRMAKGCILNTSSLVAEIGQENHAAYAATKGAVNALTKSMAIDYAKDEIRVNAVMPAAVMTPTLQQWLREQENPSNMTKFLEDIHLLGYCPDGDVIADACVFLISDKARFITGVNMPVSGGAELGYRRNV